MGHPDGAHTHGSGGSGTGTAAAVILAGIVAAAVAGPVITAAAELLRAVLIAVAVILGLVLIAGAALMAWRLRQGRRSTPLVVHQVPPVTHRAAEPLPAPQRPTIGRPAEMHLHFHGVSAEAVAAIIERNRPESP